MLARRRKKNASCVTIALLVAALICCFASPGIRGGVANALDGDDGGDGGGTNTAKTVYYNDLAQTDSDDANNLYFSGRDENGRNVYEQAEAAVNNGKVKSVRKWVYRTKDGTAKGELVRRTNPNGESYDPALLAALCVDAEQSCVIKDPDTGEKRHITILEDEASDPIGRRADNAHLHFLKDHDYAVACYDKLSSLWAGAKSVDVEAINTYTSAMYMYPDGLNNNKPSVIVRDTTNAGGHVIVFDLGDKGQLKYRIECGFQPINPDYWPTPDLEPVPDNPEPVPDEPDEPEPEPYLEPKNPEQGYQHRNPDNPDVGGGPNHNNDTTVTPDPKPEENSPDEYKAPDPPKADDSSSDTPKKNDASSGTKSGSKTVDSDNGKKETYTDPSTGKKETGTVVAGDGKDHGDMAKKVDEKPSKVEDGANPKDGGGNGECAPPE